MLSMMATHRFNPQTGLWELVSLENATGVEMSLPLMAGVSAGEVAPPVGGVNPDPVVPELVVVEEPLDILIGPWGCAPRIPQISPTIIEQADGLIIIGGTIASVLEGGIGNDLIIAGASGDPPHNTISPLSSGAPYFLLADILLGGLGQDTLIGNDLDNDLDGGAGADVMIGGGGDDFYVVNDAGDRVIEYDHGGLDWMLSWVSYILPDNVEGLTLAYRAGDINGAGNNLDNFLRGNEGRNILSGGAGNDILLGENGDTLIGGEGRDVFSLSSDWLIDDPFRVEGGNAVIADFQVGVDKIDGLWPWEFDPDTGIPFFVLPAMRQDGADTFITWGQGEIRLIGVDMRLLGAQDFSVFIDDVVFANPDFWCCG
jgi:hypothetical protein